MLRGSDFKSPKPYSPRVTSTVMFTLTQKSNLARLDYVSTIKKFNKKFHNINNKHLLIFVFMHGQLRALLSQLSVKKTKKQRSSVV